MRIRNFTITILCCASCFLGASAEQKYPVSEIPETLRENVNVVVREDHVSYRIIDKSHAVLRAHFAVTIFNENGKTYARKTIGYNKLTKINDFNAFAFDASGKQIKRLKNSEIYDQAAFDGVSLYSDQRLKSVNLVQVTYPYTVEFDYEVEYKYLYSIPGSVFISDEKVSVQKISYQLIFPQALTPRYKIINIEDNGKRSKQPDGNESILWSYENLVPIKFEPNGPHRLEVCPQIIVAPSQFEYEGYSGNMSSWKEYGKWNSKLNLGRDELPEQTKQKIKELTKGASTTQEKTKRIYEYLQSKTRYVGIQLGIGGLQPFTAREVDETGYGDCKALSNYTIAMLKEAGIKSYYTTIQAGENEPEVMLDFPSHQANHVVVAVPNGRDTLWLECTSQTKPFGYLGSFTEDRSALMITEDGGKIVRTTSYTPDQNLQSRTAEVKIDASGNALAKVRTSYSGIQYENGGLSEMVDQHQDEQKKWLQNFINLPTFTLNSFSISAQKNMIPSATVNLDLTLNRFASVSGKRFFVTPNLMNKISYIPEKVADRKTQVVRHSNYIDRDTVILELPESIYPEFLPEPTVIKSKFGEYNASVKFDQGKIIYTRTMKVWKGRYSKETYQELIDFYKNVSKADNVKLVFLSKT